jgi:hypothetical protein
VAVTGLPGTAAAADPLISQWKPATASSTENVGTPASAALDGNTGTRWSSAFGDPQWIQVDLGATANEPRVRGARHPRGPFHDLLTVSLGGTGTIDHVVNNTGAAAQGTATIPVSVVSFP